MSKSSNQPARPASPAAPPTPATNAPDLDAFNPVAQFSGNVAAPEAVDLTALRLDQTYGAIVGIKKLVTTVPVRKPSNQAYVRVHPSAEWRMPAAILQLKEDGECYFVHPSIAPSLAQEVRAKLLYVYVTRDGNVYVWPINLPSDDGRLDAWSQSAHSAAEMAQSSWVRLAANRGVGAYDIYQASGIVDEPVWPELTFKEVLHLAFKDRLITSLDHPIVKRLRGEM